MIIPGKTKDAATLSTPVTVGNGGTGASSFTAGRVLIGNGTSAILDTGNATIGGTLDVTGRLLVDSVGPSAIGQAVSGTTSLVLGGAFTSDGSSNYAYKVNVAGSLTGAAGDTARLALFRVGGTGVTTAAASETTTLVTSAFISEPSLTKGSGSTVTNATALYIDAAPSGATNNYALWVDAGATKLDGTLGVGGATTLDSTLGVGQSSPDGTVHIETGSAGSISFQGASDDLIVENSTHGGITVATPAASEGSLMFLGPTTGDLGIIAYSQASPGFQFHVANAEKARLTSTGLGVGTASPQSVLDVTISGQAKTDTGGVYAYLGKSNEASNYASLQLFAMGGSAQADRKWKFQTVEAGVANAGSIILQESGGTVGIGTATAGSTLTVNGSVSKSSGSFRIDHPLPAKQDTHHLVHSFIEGPRCDLIYRGTVTLVDGTADVDLDDAAGMSTGTWATLCRDEQCYTSNETGWHHVRGSVTGSTLTIDCEEATCTDTVSWMVVAERQDTHIMETDWTDEDGHVIVEPEKPAPDPE